ASRGPWPTRSLAWWRTTPTRSAKTDQGSRNGGGGGWPTNYPAHRTRKLIMTNEEFFRTNDMGCAAYLSLSGHPIQKVAVEDGTCWWFFINFYSLQELMETFTSDEALVNPREYTKSYGQVKKTLRRAMSGRAH